MPQVIAYDITDDARRRRVAKLLQRCAWRVQKSVFEASLSTERLRRLERDLAVILDAKAGDRVIVYPCDADELERAWRIGINASTPGVLFFDDE